MPILTFQKRFKDALLNGSKRQTCRYNLEYWWKLIGHPFLPPEHYRKFNKCLEYHGCDSSPHSHKLMIWCPSPRCGNGQHLFDTREYIIAPILGVEFPLVKDIDTFDGFKSVADLVNALMELHNLTREEFDAHMWAVIRWKRDTGVESGGTKRRSQESNRELPGLGGQDPSARDLGDVSIRSEPDSSGSPADGNNNVSEPLGGARDPDHSSGQGPSPTVDQAVGYRGPPVVLQVDGLPSHGECLEGWGVHNPAPVEGQCALALRGDIGPSEGRVSLGHDLLHGHARVRGRATTWGDRPSQDIRYPRRYPGRAGQGRVHGSRSPDPARCRGPGPRCSASSKDNPRGGSIGSPRGTVHLPSRGRGSCIHPRHHLEPNKGSRPSRGSAFVASRLPPVVRERTLESHPRPDIDQPTLAAFELGSDKGIHRGRPRGCSGRDACSGVKTGSDSTFGDSASNRGRKIRVSKNEILVELERVQSGRVSLSEALLSREEMDGLRFMEEIGRAHV